MTDYPKWMYRKGNDGKPEGKLFDRPEDVPEGYVESPADIGKPKAKKKTNEA